MKEIYIPKPSNKKLQEAEKYGGSDFEDWGAYQDENLPYYDKGGHKERSIANDQRSGGHIKHK